MTRQHRGAQGPGGTERRKATPVRPVPERSEDLAHLSLTRLRAYRQVLSEEENRVSYWRRIFQARLDLVRSGARADPSHIESLRSVLRGSQTGGGRGALVTVVPVDDIPPLPDLTGLWERDLRPDDEKYNRRLIRDLEKAEVQLSAYRNALHARIATATSELIARYRDQPGLCLAALPDMSEQRRAAI